MVPKFAMLRGKRVGVANHWKVVTPVDEWWLSPPNSLEEKLALINREESHLNEDSPRGEALRSLFEELKQIGKDVEEQARSENPLAFVEPYWEQILKLNAWVWGISFVCDFDANRKGKTMACILSALLWMFPNDPAWTMFQPFIDKWGRDARLLPRPSIEKVKLIQQYLRAHPDLIGNPNYQPYDEDSGNADKFRVLKSALPECFRSCFPEPPCVGHKFTAWQGAPDADYHKLIIMPEWRKWIPKAAIKSDSEYDKKFVLDIVYTNARTKQEKKVEWTIIFKSYESKDEKFSGAAVKAIVLTEGVKQAHLNEIKQRFQSDAFASWDYTPYESRNTGQKSAIAHKVFQGKESLPLNPYVFSGFGIQKVPEYVLSEEKRMDLVRMWSGKAEGKARLEGKFYTSSPVVLAHLDLHFHGVPWTKKELFERYPEGLVYRSMDPGWDHPTVGAWGLLTKTNTWFIYRLFSEPGLSIGERCKKMIEMSGNTREIKRYGPGDDDYFYEELHPTDDSEIAIQTITDYHAFETDQITKRPYSTNYIKEGLIITPSSTLGPKQRAQTLDGILTPSLILPHPSLQKPPGCKLYFLINETGVAEACEKLENIFWDRYTTGDKRGMPKDEIQDFDDDELDAVTYLACSAHRWTNLKPKRKEQREYIGSRNPVTSYQKPQIRAVKRRPRFASTGY